MIRRLRLKNFRSHADTEISFEPISLLVGPSGGGKSNILKALVFLQSSIFRDLEELFYSGGGEFRSVRSRWAEETAPMSFEVELAQLTAYPGATFRYRLELGDSPSGVFVADETLQLSEGSNFWRVVFQRTGRPDKVDGFGFVDIAEPTLLHRAMRLRLETKERDTSSPVEIAGDVAIQLGGIAYHHLDVATLKQSGLGQPSLRLGYRGEQLPDLIAKLKEVSRPDSGFFAIQAGMRELLPDLRAILVTQGGPGRQSLAFSFHGHAGAIPAQDLSDGSMLSLGMMSLIYGFGHPVLQCIEEPETGLHPRRLRWLYDALVGLAYPEPGTPRTQVLLTTHSPDLVDFFRDVPESVNVVDHEVIKSSGERRSRVTPLSKILAKLNPSGERIESPGQAWATGLYENL